jgi:hypothetical protein
MSEIENLKNNAVVIDTTNPTNDTVEEESGTRINMMGGKTIITPKHTVSETTDSERVTVTPTTAKEEEEIHKSEAYDILNGDDSPFAKYLEEKKEEYVERMAQFDDEMKLKEEERAAKEAEADNDEEATFGTDSSYEEAERADEGTTEESYNRAHGVQFEEENEPAEAVEEEKHNVIKPEQSVENIILNGTDSEFVNDEEVKEEEDADDALKKLQTLITEKIKPISKKLDISSFTVAKKPTANITALTSKNTRAAKWVLPGQGIVVLMSEFSGVELENLRQLSEDPNSFAMLSRKYHIIYDHIVSAKPATFESWMKRTPFSDNDHYFFAAYIASYKGANYIPYDCSDQDVCKETWISDDIDIINMVEFKDDAAKAEFNEIYESENQTTSKGLYLSEMVPLNEKVAIGFKEPTLYSLLEVASLDRAFKEKHSIAIQFLPYIDGFYLIEDGTLVPIGYSIYPNNGTKSTKSKVSKYEQVINTLESDELGLINSYIREISRNQSNITYKYPAATCPKCGKETKDNPTTAEQLLFTRYQLGALVNTSLS